MGRLRIVLRTAGVLAGLAAAAWALKDRLLPAPELQEPPPPPRYRTGPPSPPPDPDDLTDLTGVGPTYAARLADAGFRTFADLAAAEPKTVAAAAGTSERRAAGWIRQAADRS